MRKTIKIFILFVLLIADTGKIAGAQNNAIDSPQRSTQKVTVEKTNQSKPTGNADLPKRQKSREIDPKKAIKPEPPEVPPAPRPLPPKTPPKPKPKRKIHSNS